MGGATGEKQTFLQFSQQTTVSFRTGVEMGGAMGEKQTFLWFSQQTAVSFRTGGEKSEANAVRAKKKDKEFLLKVSEDHDENTCLISDQHQNRKKNP